MILYIKYPWLGILTRIVLGLGAVVYAGHFIVIIAIGLAFSGEAVTWNDYLALIYWDAALIMLLCLFVRGLWCCLTPYFLRTLKINLIMTGIFAIVWTSIILSDYKTWYCDSPAENREYFLEDMKDILEAISYPLAVAINMAVIKMIDYYAYPEYRGFVLKTLLGRKYRKGRTRRVGPPW